MSTKIYNGYRLYVSSLDEAAAFAGELRTKLRGAIEDAVCDSVFRKAVNIADRRALRKAQPLLSIGLLSLASEKKRFEDAMSSMRAGLGDVASSYRSLGLGLPGEVANTMDAFAGMEAALSFLPDLSELEMEAPAIRAALARALGDYIFKTQCQRCHGVDTEVSMVVYRDEGNDGFPDRYFAQIFAASPLLLEALKDERLVAFPYWDNADGPDGVSERAWEMRGRLWTRLLGNGGVPALAGTTFQLSDVRALPVMDTIRRRVEDLIETLPPESERAVPLARDEWISERVLELREAAPAGCATGFAFHEMVMQARDEASGQDLEDRVARIAGALPRPTVALLMGDDIAARPSGPGV